MVHRIALFALVLLSVSSAAFAQTPNRQNAATAPRHDISGTWAPADGPGAGIQAGGVKAMPNDGKPEHELPYTPYGIAIYKTHKALEGKDMVAPAFYNDPRDFCEPIGFPRADHYNLRETQIMQNEFKVAILYQYAQTWRIVWKTSDGRWRRQL